jgi:hypothetical protein
MPQRSNYVASQRNSLEYLARQISKAVLRLVGAAGSVSRVCRFRQKRARLTPFRKAPSLASTSVSQIFPTARRNNHDEAASARCPGASGAPVSVAPKRVCCRI